MRRALVLRWWLVGLLGAGATVNVESFSEFGSLLRKCGAQGGGRERGGVGVGVPNSRQLLLASSGREGRRLGRAVVDSDDAAPVVAGSGAGSSASLNSAVTVAAVISLLVVASSLYASSLSSPESLAHASHASLGAFDPRTSMEAGAAAGFVRALTRSVTFGLDTYKTRAQLSRIPENILSKLPREQRMAVEKKKDSRSLPSVRDLYAGYVPFVLQAGPSNAVFFLCYDGLVVLFQSLAPLISINILRVIASTLATIPTSMIRVPPEVIKQRLQSRDGGGSTSWIRFGQEIVRNEGWGGLYVGCESQLLRELPFNVLQFVAYGWLEDSPLVISYLGDSLASDAGIGALASGFAALLTHPFDVIKTRQMTNTIHVSEGDEPTGLLKRKGPLADGIAIARSEGWDTLFLGLLPRIALVTTGGASYFVAQEALRKFVALPS